VNAPRISARKVPAFVSSFLFVLFAVSVSTAFAALTLNGTSISGDSNSTIDASGTVTIGASQATGITIGRSGVTTTLPGNLQITGTCVGCFTANGDLSGTGSSQTVTHIQGVSVTSTSPTMNQVLQYNGSLWVPATLSMTGSTVSINTVATSSYVFTGTANQITIATTTTPGVFVWSLPSNLSIANATATGNLTVLGSLLDAGGNKYVTSTAGGVSSLNNLTGAVIATGTANEIAVVSSSGQLVFSTPQNINTNSTPTFGGLTLTGSATGTSLQLSGALSGSSTLTIAGATSLQSSLNQSGGVASLASTTINGNATTTGNLAVLGSLLDAGGNKYVTSTASASQWATTSTGIYYNGGNVTVSSTIPVGAPTGSVAVSGNVYAGSPTVPQQLATLNAAINAQTGTTYTLQASDNGEVLTFNNASGITLTVPSGLGAGFNCLIVQLGAGTVTPTSSAATIYQRQSLTQTAGQYAVATLVAIAPNTFILSGDLQ
jgi:hypothetical protein